MRARIGRAILKQTRIEEADKSSACSRWRFEGEPSSLQCPRAGASSGLDFRATESLKRAEHNNAPLLTIGLDHLSLGRGYPPNSPESTTHLKQAVEYIRRAGQLDYLPLALLARATPRDLEEVRTLATRCSMKLHLTDYHLAMARRENSLQHLNQAAACIAETGYHRRDPELAELRAQLTPQVTS